MSLHGHRRYAALLATALALSAALAPAAVAQVEEARVQVDGMV